VAMVEAIARSQGRSTAAFTSPHLHFLNERIRVDGAPIDDDAFARSLADVLNPAVPWLTFFEGIAACFFVAARYAEVDTAIVEVGLGGRLDATNLIGPPAAAAIVSIGLDHTRILGPDHATIASEKAGIIKTGSPVVLGPLVRAAYPPIAERINTVGAGPVYAVLDDGPPPPLPDAIPLHLSDGHMRVHDEMSALSPPLSGAHQRANAAVAVGCAIAAGWGQFKPLVAGLRDTHWPGRLERVDLDGDRYVLFDAAHNVDGASALGDYLSHDPRPTTLIFGAMADKPWPEMLDRLAPHASARCYAPALEERIAQRTPAPPDALAAHHAGEAWATAALAWRRAVEVTPAGGRIVVAGSLFLLGAVRAVALGLPRDVTVPL
ncbi:MAG: cyanophycin synthetase, partial [Myxococcota bacterium]